MSVTIHLVTTTVVLVVRLADVIRAPTYYGIVRDTSFGCSRFILSSGFGIVMFMVSKHILERMLLLCA